jgi:hypothetical protein
MPKRKRSYSSKKTRGKKRSKTSKKYNFVPRLALRTAPSVVGGRRGPLPKRLTTTLTFVESGLLSTSSDTISSGTWSLNSIYEPRAGTNRQPLGFDQMMTFYDAYTVIRAHYRVDFAAVYPTDPTSAPASEPNYQICCFTVPIDETGALSAATTLKTIEQGGCEYAFVGPANGGKNTCQLSGSFSPPTWLGRQQGNAVNDSTLRGTVSTSPSEQMYLRVGIGPKVLGTLLGALDTAYTIKIVYEVVFHEPKTLVESTK